MKPFLVTIEGSSSVRSSMKVICIQTFMIGSQNAQFTDHLVYGERSPNYDGINRCNMVVKKIAFLSEYSHLLNLRRSNPLLRPTCICNTLTTIIMNP